MGKLTSFEQEVAGLIIETLNLEGITPGDIEPQAALFREGLGLDSIDALEISLAIGIKYGFQLRSDDSDNVRIFSSLRVLSEHIARNRTR